MGVVIVIPWRKLNSCCLHLTSRETEIGMPQFILCAQNLVIHSNYSGYLGKPRRKCAYLGIAYIFIRCSPTILVTCSSSQCYANARNILGLESSHYVLTLSVFPASFLNYDLAVHIILIYDLMSLVLFRASHYFPIKKECFFACLHPFKICLVGNSKAK